MGIRGYMQGYVGKMLVGSMLFLFLSGIVGLSWASSPEDKMPSLHLDAEREEGPSSPRSPRSVQLEARPTEERSGEDAAVHSPNTQNTEEERQALRRGLRVSYPGGIFSINLDPDVFRELRTGFEQEARKDRMAVFQGGGVRGAFSAAAFRGILEQIQAQLCEETFVAETVQDFCAQHGISLAALHGREGWIPLHDLVSEGIATSTGSIILAALTTPSPEDPKVAAYTTEDVLRFFREEAPDIFSACALENCGRNLTCKAPSCWAALGKWLCCCGFWGCCRNCNGLCGPKYGHALLEALLQEQLGEDLYFQASSSGQRSPLIPIHFVAFDLEHNKPIYFGPRKTPRVPVWEGVRSSAAAPTFFMPYKTNFSYEGHYRRRLMIDGAVVENMPIAQAAHILRENIVQQRMEDRGNEEQSGKGGSSGRGMASLPPQRGRSSQSLVEEEGAGEASSSGAGPSSPPGADFLPVEKLLQEKMIIAFGTGDRTADLPDGFEYGGALTLLPKIISVLTSASDAAHDLRL